MVQAVRAGGSMREVAARFGISPGALTYWVAQARGKRLDRASFANRKPGRPWNRTPAVVEQLILGGRPDAWVMERPRATSTVDALLERWRREGLPDYAQFDNDTIFQGTHRFADSVGRICRLCLALGVIPVFAPPREPGFQNAIEGFNGLWQSKVWQRHHCSSVAALRRVSANYIKAHRVKTAHRRELGPARRRVPTHFTWDATDPLRGSLIFIRRSDEHGAVNLLGRGYPVDQNWPHRLVRCDVDFTQKR